MLVETVAAGKVKHMSNHDCLLLSLRQKHSSLFSDRFEQQTIFTEDRIVIPILPPY